MEWSERFTAKVGTSDDGCWPWLGGRTTPGYGKFWRDNRTLLAHRVAYELWVGPIPAGLQLDHLCRNRICVNPAHLEPVTVRENLHRGVGTVAAENIAKTHCPSGHEYNAANTYRAPDGSRMCRPCMRARDRARYWRQRAAG